ncbi:hypothetical protein Ddc_17552 [Ditylenchus destructor]|nr:hypothetical protein Ddc_17552 [Ditylenchus destructor]
MSVIVLEGSRRGEFPPKTPKRDKETQRPVGQGPQAFEDTESLGGRFVVYHYLKDLSTSYHSCHIMSLHLNTAHHLNKLFKVSTQSQKSRGPKITQRILIKP